MICGKGVCPTRRSSVINSIGVSNRAAGRRADQRAEALLCNDEACYCSSLDGNIKIQIGLMDSIISWAKGHSRLYPHIKAAIPVLMTRPWPPKSGVRDTFCLQVKVGEMKRGHHM